MSRQQNKECRRSFGALSESKHDANCSSNKKQGRALSRNSFRSASDSVTFSSRSSDGSAQECEASKHDPKKLHSLKTDDSSRLGNLKTFQSDPLRDPAFLDYLANPKILRRLKRLGLITKDGKINTSSYKTLEEYRRRYRQRLAMMITKKKMEKDELTKTATEEQRKQLQLAILREEYRQKAKRYKRHMASMRREARTARRNYRQSIKDYDQLSNDGARRRQKKVIRQALKEHQDTRKYLQRKPDHEQLKKDPPLVGTRKLEDVKELNKAPVILRLQRRKPKMTRIKLWKRKKIRTRTPLEQEVMVLKKLRKRQRKRTKVHLSKLLRRLHAMPDYRACGICGNQEQQTMTVLKKKRAKTIKCLKERTFQSAKFNTLEGLSHDISVDQIISHYLASLHSIQDDDRPGEQPEDVFGTVKETDQDTRDFSTAKQYSDKEAVFVDPITISSETKETAEELPSDVRYYYMPHETATMDQETVRSPGSKRFTDFETVSRFRNEATQTHSVFPRSETSDDDLQGSIPSFSPQSTSSTGTERRSSSKLMDSGIKTSKETVVKSSGEVCNTHQVNALSSNQGRLNSLQDLRRGLSENEVLQLGSQPLMEVTRTLSTLADSLHQMKCVNDAEDNNKDDVYHQLAGVRRALSSISSFLKLQRADPEPLIDVYRAVSELFKVYSAKLIKTRSDSCLASSSRQSPSDDSFDDTIRAVKCHVQIVPSNPDVRNSAACLSTSIPLCDQLSKLLQQFSGEDVRPRETDELLDRIESVIGQISRKVSKDSESKSKSKEVERHEEMDAVFEGVARMIKDTLHNVADALMDMAATFETRKPDLFDQSTSIPLLNLEALLDTDNDTDSISVTSVSTFSQSVQQTPEKFRQRNPSQRDERRASLEQEQSKRDQMKNLPVLVQTGSHKSTGVGARPKVFSKQNAKTTEAKKLKSEQSRSSKASRSDTKYHGKQPSSSHCSCQRKEYISSSSSSYSSQESCGVCNRATSEVQRKTKRRQSRHLEGRGRQNEKIRDDNVTPCKMCQVPSVPTVYSDRGTSVVNPCVESLISQLQEMEDLENIDLSKKELGDIMREITAETTANLKDIFGDILEHPCFKQLRSDDLSSRNSEPRNQSESERTESEQTGTLGHRTTSIDYSIQQNRQDLGSNQTEDDKDVEEKVSVLSALIISILTEVAEQQRSSSRDKVPTGRREHQSKSVSVVHDNLCTAAQVRSLENSLSTATYAGQTCTSESCVGSPEKRSIESNCLPSGLNEKSSLSTEPSSLRKLSEFLSDLFGAWRSMVKSSGGSTSDETARTDSSETQQTELDLQEKGVQAQSFTNSTKTSKSFNTDNSSDIVHAFVEAISERMYSTNQERSTEELRQILSCSPISDIPSDSRSHSMLKVTPSHEIEDHDSTHPEESQVCHPQKDSEESTISEFFSDNLDVFLSGLLRELFDVDLTSQTSSSTKEKHPTQASEQGIRDVASKNCQHISATKTEKPSQMEVAPHSETSASTDNAEGILTKVCECVVKNSLPEDCRQLDTSYSSELRQLNASQEPQHETSVVSSSVTAPESHTAEICRNMPQLQRSTNSFEKIPMVACEQRVSSIVNKHIKPLDSRKTTKPCQLDVIQQPQYFVAAPSLTTSERHPQETHQEDLVGSVPPSHKNDAEQSGNSQISSYNILNAIVSEFLRDISQKERYQKLHRSTDTFEQIPMEACEQTTQDIVHRHVRAMDPGNAPNPCQAEVAKQPQNERFVVSSSVSASERYPQEIRQILRGRNKLKSSMKVRTLAKEIEDHSSEPLLSSVAAEKDLQSAKPQASSDILHVILSDVLREISQKDKYPQLQRSTNSSKQIPMEVCEHIVRNSAYKHTRPIDPKRTPLPCHIDVVKQQESSRTPCNNATQEIPRKDIGLNYSKIQYNLKAGLWEAAENFRLTGKNKYRNQCKDKIQQIVHYTVTTSFADKFSRLVKFKRRQLKMRKDAKLANLDSPIKNLAKHRPSTKPKETDATFEMEPVASNVVQAIVSSLLGTAVEASEYNSNYKVEERKRAEDKNTNRIDKTSLKSNPSSILEMFIGNFLRETILSHSDTHAAQRKLTHGNHHSGKNVVPRQTSPSNLLSGESEQNVTSPTSFPSDVVADMVRNILGETADLEKITVEKVPSVELSHKGNKLSNPASSSLTRGVIRDIIQSELQQNQKHRLIASSVSEAVAASPTKTESAPDKDDFIKSCSSCLIHQLLSNILTTEKDSAGRAKVKQRSSLQEVIKPTSTRYIETQENTPEKDVTSNVIEHLLHEILKPLIPQNIMSNSESSFGNAVDLEHKASSVSSDRSSIPDRSNPTQTRQRILSRPISSHRASDEKLCSVGSISSNVIDDILRRILENENENTPEETSPNRVPSSPLSRILAEVIEEESAEQSIQTGEEPEHVTESRIIQEVVNDIKAHCDSRTSGTREDPSAKSFEIHQTNERNTQSEEPVQPVPSVSSSVILNIIGSMFNKKLQERQQTDDDVVTSNMKTADAVLSDQILRQKQSEVAESGQIVRSCFADVIADVIKGILRQHRQNEEAASKQPYAAERIQRSHDVLNIASEKSNSSLQHTIKQLIHSRSFSSEILQEVVQRIIQQEIQSRRSTADSQAKTNKTNIPIVNHSQSSTVVPEVDNSQYPTEVSPCIDGPLDSSSISTKSFSLDSYEKVAPKTVGCSDLDDPEKQINPVSSESTNETRKSDTSETGLTESRLSRFHLISDTDTCDNCFDKSQDHSNYHSENSPTDDEISPMDDEKSLLTNDLNLPQERQKTSDVSVSNGGLKQLLSEIRVSPDAKSSGYLPAESSELAVSRDSAGTLSDIISQILGPKADGSSVTYEQSLTSTGSVESNPFHHLIILQSLLDSEPNAETATELNLVQSAVSDALHTFNMERGRSTSSLLGSADKTVNSVSSLSDTTLRSLSSTDLHKILIEICKSLSDNSGSP